MSNEILPLPEIINVPSTVDYDLLNFKFYRSGWNSNRIIVTVNTDYKDLPIAVADNVVPPDTFTSNYLVTQKNNLIQYSNAVTPTFTLNSGVYKYDIEVECYSDFAGQMGVLLSNAAGVPYRDDAIVIKDITSASTTVVFSALISHNAGDLVKLRFTGGKTGATPGPINLNISYINLYIEKK
jgi:hypothetical protein